jgi:hypothetical protein
MINISKTRAKSYISSWFLALFVFSLLVAAMMTELFQLAPDNDLDNSLYANPIKSDILANLKTMVIKNRLGNFTISEENGQWMLKEPRVMPLKTTTKNKIFQALESITVKNIHQYEPINLSSFSLDRPILSLGLYTKLDEKVTMNMGLINPINNTTYLTVSNQKRIFQTDILLNKMETLELVDFIDARIFSISAKKLTSFELYRGKNREASYAITKTGTNWASKRFKKISNDSTFNKLNKILNIKAHYILDKQDEQTVTTINNYLQNPLYRIKLKSGDRMVEYKISNLIRSLPNIKLEKRQNFIVKASDRPNPYIVDKQYLNQLQIRYKDLK